MDEETREAIVGRATKGAMTALGTGAFTSEQESTLSQAIAQALVDALDEWMNTYYEIEDVEDDFEQ